MRTAIFLGLIMIAVAIRKDCLVDNPFEHYWAAIFGVIMGMDVYDFFNKK